MEERDVGVGVFPGGEEILVGDAGFRGVALLLIDAAQFQLRGNDQEVGAMRIRPEDTLEIFLRLGETSGLRVGHTPAEENAGVAARVEGGSVFQINGLGGVGFGGIGGEQIRDGANRGNGDVLRDGIVRMGALDLVGKAERLLSLAGER